MSDIELSEEELALLELDNGDESANVLDELPPIVVPAKRKPRKPPAAERPPEPVPAPLAPEPKLVEPEPILVEPEPMAMTPPMTLGRRNPDHPLAPPAQHDYGDPWGTLPVQMRPKGF